MSGTQKMRTLTRRKRAFRLRLAGYSYEEIGSRLKITKQAVHQIIQDVLHELQTELAENAGKVRELEVSRLDAITVALWPRRKEPRVAETLLRVNERRARMLGLDKPTTATMTVEVNANDALGKLAALLTRRLAALDEASDAAGAAAQLEPGRS